MADERNPTGDPLIGQAEEAEAAARAANLFDVRRFIGGLFLIYGAVLTALGLFASQAEIDKAAGVNANLWTGLVMLIVGGGFLFWALRAPVGAEELADGDGNDAGEERSRGH